ncbi:hypothetical protein G195_005712 [Phytophthora kernoviae 00238/432]|uniref:Uncharacterized protein n=1 Tax=Phytophthora kernoviae 00238/432 TaxID=1284355 RepID=A0A8J4WGC6_9STRA|nr:hypothetical protein G195_005712 [Phytophthora kernoviae 00238/432]
MKVSTLSAYGAAAMLLVSSVAATEQSTPAPTTTAPIYDEELGCWPISVEHDATYCIDGPICSGNGPSPTGSLCPVKGDVAIADCHSYLASFVGDDNCALPVDATCQVIKTGAWGCVIPGSATPAPTKAAVVGAICAVAAAVAAIAGVAIYRQHTKKVEEEEEETQMVDVITP